VVAAAVVALSACGNGNANEDPPRSAGASTGPPGWVTTAPTAPTDRIYFGKKSTAVGDDFERCKDFEVVPDQAPKKESLGLDWYDVGTCTFILGDYKSLLTVYTFKDQDQQDTFVRDLDKTGGLPGAIGPGVYVVMVPADAEVAPLVGPELGISTRVREGNPTPTGVPTTSRPQRSSTD